MDEKFTPEGWEVGNPDEDKDDYIIIDTLADWPIAIVSRFDRVGLRNANLMAASLDMAKALQAILNDGDWTVYDQWMPSKESIQLAERALLKARGELEPKPD